MAVEREVREQLGHLRAVQDKEPEQADERERDGAHGGDARRSERFQQIKQSLHGNPT
jgi:hypothetical protein